MTFKGFESQLELAGRFIRKRRLPKPLAPRVPLAVEREYQRDLREFVRDLADAIERRLIPALPSLVRQQEFYRPALVRNDADESSVRQDAAPEEVAEIMRGIRLQFEEQWTEDRIRQMANKNAELTQRFNREVIRRNVRKVIGIDPLFGDSFLRSEMALFAVQNVGLITSLRDDTIRKMETLTLERLRGGVRHEDIAREIRKYIDPDVGNVRARANLIARDQIGKLNGQLTQLRQTDIGIKRYIWRAVGDERTRPAHLALDGKVFRWDAPPVTNSNGDRNHPGEDYQCRCYAEPVFEDVVPGLEPQEEID